MEGLPELFSHSFQHMTGTDSQGQSVDRTVRVTNGGRKIGGNRLIALEPFLDGSQTSCTFN